VMANDRLKTVGRDVIPRGGCEPPHAIASPPDSRYPSRTPRPLGQVDGTIPARLQ